MSRTVSVPAQRLPRWIDGFVERHGGTPDVTDGCLAIQGSDGSSCSMRTMFPEGLPTTVADFIDQAAHPPRCAVVVVRRGGFAAAVVDDGHIVASDLGRRHVQSRTAAGGWSQQRFARRREKQANELVDAAVGYVMRTVVPLLPVAYIVTGGDRPLVDAVLSDARLRSLARVPRGPHLAIGDPRRDQVAALPRLLTEVRIELADAP